jgi:DNA-binding CsgD family transcriptional regulator
MKKSTTKANKTTPFETVRKKTSATMLSQFFVEQFPQMGHISRAALVKNLIKHLGECYPKNKHMKTGQLFWFAVDKDVKPGYGKTIEKSKLKPVILDLVTDDDLEDLKNKIRAKDFRKKRTIRLFTTSAEQGGILTCSDVASILQLSIPTISRYVREYEKETGKIVPRRGTVHDMGPSLTHKKDICYKIIVEGKTVEQVARETDHSPEAITRYVKDYKRIYVCLSKGLSIESTAYVAKVSKRLVLEYSNLIEEYNLDKEENRDKNST